MKVLGIDLGTQSIGFAYVKIEGSHGSNGGAHGEILDMGVRIFEGGKDKLGQSKEASRAEGRRIARGMRRQLYRTARRLKKLDNLLKMAGFERFDPDTASRQEIDEFNPYFLRDKGLETKLDKRQLATALYQLAQHRGFKSNRKQAASEGEDNTTIAEGSDQVRGANDVPDELTYGQYFAQRRQQGEKIRSQYTFRRKYEDEFDALITEQRKHHPELTQAYIGDLREAIYYQRPLKMKQELRGGCELLPDKKRTPKSRPINELVGLWQRIHDFRITWVNGDEMPPPINEAYLNVEQKQALFNYLIDRNEIKLDKPKAREKLAMLLDLPQAEDYIVSVGGPKKALKGTQTICAILKATKRKFSSYSLDELERIWNLLYSTNKPGVLEQVLAKPPFEFSDEVVSELAKILPSQDMASHSYVALQLLLEQMRDKGLTYTEAKAEIKKAKGLDETEVTLLEKLPPLADFKDVRNPVVERALSQLRRVVNELISRHGKPERIQIELARDLKASVEARKRMTRDNSKRFDKNDAARRELKKHNVYPSLRQIQKYNLWLECDKTCPYTGKAISFEALFGDNPQFDIEHILPWKRSLDDSYMNKLLCERTVNAEKGDKTPFEAFNGQQGRYQEMLARLKAHVEAKRMPEAKLKRFQDSGFKDREQGFAQRQMNDTRYISVLAKDYVKLICDDVRTLQGGVTSKLRVSWGLAEVFKDELANYLSTHLDRVWAKKPEEERQMFIESIIGSRPGTTNKQAGKHTPGVRGKLRLDHRHHALDALVIAMTELRYVQQINRQSGRGQTGKHIFANAPLPFADFHKQTRKWLRQIIISHQHSRRISGPLHKKSLYGQRHTPDAGQKYVIRKPVTTLTSGELSRVVDPLLRNLLQATAEQHDGDLSKAGDIRHPNGHSIKSVRIAVNNEYMDEIRQGTFVESKSSLLYLLYELPESSTNSRRKGKNKDALIIRMLDAYRLKTTHGASAIYNSELLKLPTGATPLLTLSGGELIVADPTGKRNPEEILAEVDLEDKSTYARLAGYVYKINTYAATTKQIKFFPHNAALYEVSGSSKELKLNLQASAKPNTLNAIRLWVTSAGYLQLAEEEFA